METLEFGKFTLTNEGYLSFMDNEPILLTPRENGILRYLASHRNQVVPLKDILLAVWNNDDFFIERSACVFVTRLRKLLKNDSDVKIESIGDTAFRLVV